MQHYWPYIFCLFIMGALGLYIGHASRSDEVSLLKEMILYGWHEKEKQIVVLNVEPIVPVSFESHQEPQASAQADTVDYMKQIAHVQVPQETPESGVSKSSSRDQDDVTSVYKKHIEHACKVLCAINHQEKPVRVRARLELGELCVSGPLSKYVQELVSKLLVRYCDDDGMLVHMDYDESVAQDVLKAVALLEKELDGQSDWVTVARVDFTPLQRRVQRHAHNGVLKKQFTSSYIPYTGDSPMTG